MPHTYGHNKIKQSMYIEQVQYIQCSEKGTTIWSTLVWKLCVYTAPHTHARTKCRSNFITVLIAIIKQMFSY